MVRIESLADVEDYVQEAIAQLAHSQEADFGQRLARLQAEMETKIGTEVQSACLTFGEPTAGAGAFIRFGQHLGGRCVFFAESDSEAASIAAAEAPTATQFGDICSVHPTTVPAVFTLLGGPECQPFSAAA